MKALEDSLSQIDWSELIEDNAPNKSMTNLHDKLLSEVEHFTPVRTYNLNPKKPGENLGEKLVFILASASVKSCVVNSFTINQISALRPGIGPMPNYWDA